MVQWSSCFNLVMASVITSLCLVEYVKCFNIDVCIYSTCAASSSFCFVFVSSWHFCHVDIDVCIYSTCVFLIVKWILMLIMYSAASL